MIRFHSVDSLTGAISGRLYPHEWEWTDPLTGHTSGRLRLALPDPDEVDALAALTRPRVRWVAVEDDGVFVTGGPITRRPGRDGDDIVVPFGDWRIWLYRRFVTELTSSNAVQDVSAGYVRKDVEQVEAMRDLMGVATTGDTEGRLPKLVVDQNPINSEVTREVTVRPMQTSIGDALDGISNRSDAPEWWTYITRVDETTLLPHVAVAYPERGGKLHLVEHRLAFQETVGGNTTEYTWPEGVEAPTRVWATGDGEPPAQSYAYDQLPEADDDPQEDVEPDIVWELVSNHSGADRTTTLFDHAQDELDALSALSGQASFTVAADKIALRDLEVGDRTRLVFSDGWESVDLPAVRIIQRRVTGGKGKPLLQKLTVDLGDSEPPLGEEDPGVDGVDEEEG